MQHYAQVTEADIQEAVKMSLLNEAEISCQGKRVHNRVQTTAAPARTESHELQEVPAVSPYNCESKREFATP